MAVKKIRKPCPYCGSEEFVRGAYQNKQVFDLRKPFSPYYTVQVQICKRCGSIVREFIAKTENFPDY